MPIKNLHIFVQYVTTCHHYLLAEFDSQEQHGLHQLILEVLREN